MTDTQPQLADAELADQITAAVSHGLRFAEADPDSVLPETVNAVLAAVLSELDRLRAELAAVRACDCFPNPNDHADRCPIYQAAVPAGEEW